MKIKKAPLARGLLEYGSKSIISVIPRAPGRAAIAGFGQDAAEADDHAAPERKRVYGLVRVDTAAIIVAIVIGAACGVKRSEQLRFQLNTDARGNVDICSHLESSRKIGVRGVA